VQRRKRRSADAIEIFFGHGVPGREDRHRSIVDRTERIGRSDDGLADGNHYDECHAFVGIRRGVSDRTEVRGLAPTATDSARAKAKRKRSRI